MARRVARTERPKRPAHRPLTLTPRVAGAIVSAVEDGNHIITACALSGVPRSTYYLWMERAADVAHMVAQHDPDDPEAEPLELTDEEHRYLDFMDKILQARARAENRAVQVVERSMAGGFLISEKPVLDSEGDPVRDEDGSLAYERVWTQPDGRLALQYLARSRPDVWGQNPTQRVEITGPEDAGSAGVAPQGTVTALAARIAEIQQRNADEDDEDDGIQEAEIVDEPEGRVDVSGWSAGG